jgi:hypothetical protein
MKKKTWLRKFLLQVVNFGSKAVSLNISVTGLETDIQTFGSIKTVLTSGWLRDENSFQQPDKVWYCGLDTVHGKLRSIWWLHLELVVFVIIGGAGGKSNNQRGQANGCYIELVLPDLIWSPLGLGVSGSSLHPSLWLVWDVSCACPQYSIPRYGSPQGSPQGFQ